MDLVEIKKLIRANPFPNSGNYFTDDYKKVLDSIGEIEYIFDKYAYKTDFETWPYWCKVIKYIKGIKGSYRKTVHMAHLDILGTCDGDEYRQRVYDLHFYRVQNVLLVEEEIKDGDEIYKEDSKPHFYELMLMHYTDEAPQKRVHNMEAATKALDAEITSIHNYMIDHPDMSKEEKDNWERTVEDIEFAIQELDNLDQM